MHMLEPVLIYNFFQCHNLFGLLTFRSILLHKNSYDMKHLSSCDTRKYLKKHLSYEQIVVKYTTLSSLVMYMYGKIMVHNLVLENIKFYNDFDNLLWFCINIISY